MTRPKLHIGSSGINGIVDPTTWKTLEEASSARYMDMPLFALTWIQNPLDFTISTDAFKVIAPVWFQVTTNAITGEVIIDPQRASAVYSRSAHEQGIQVWGTLQSFNPTTTRYLVTTPPAADKFIKQVVDYCVAFELDGLNIDFENMYVADKYLFTEFVRKLASALRQSALSRQIEFIVSINVTTPPGERDTNNMWSASVDRGPLSEICDYMIIMAYDQHGSFSVPGPVASYNWVRNGIEAMLKEVPARKMLLGVPLYSVDWTSHINPATNQYELDGIVFNLKMDAINSAVTTGGYQDNTGSTITVNEWIVTPAPQQGELHFEFIDTAGVLHNIWAEYPVSLSAKIGLIKEFNLSGLATWEYSFGNQAAFNVINNEINTPSYPPMTK